MGALLQDLRYGVRMLCKNPGFTAVAVLTLALGIGANTAVFSVLDAVLLRPLPYSEPDRLMWVRSLDIRGTPHPDILSYPDFFDYRARNHSFDQLIVYRESQFTLTVSGQPVHLDGEIVCWDLFPLLGVRPALGRGFLPSEETPGTHVVVLSHELWQRQFGADRSLVGRAITINRQPYIVAGVAPAGFRFPEDNPSIQLWTTIALEGEGPPGSIPITRQRGARLLPALGRLKPGITTEQARSDLEVIANALAEEYPDSNTNIQGAVVVPELERLVGETRRPLRILFGAVGLVLVIACANIANLLLARATGRKHEMAVRAAVGASQSRIVRQLFTESLLLSLLASAAGAMLAEYALRIILPLGGNSIPRLAQARIDGLVLAFAILLGVLTSVLFGIAPAHQASKVDLQAALKEGARTTVGGQSKLRGALVVAEITFGLVLVTAAGLLMANFLHLEQGELGMRRDHLLTFWFNLPDSQYAGARQVTFYDLLLERLRAVPGVQSVGGVWPLPLGGDRATVSFDIQERPVPVPQRPHSDMAFVTPDYFSTAGIPLLKGRVFTERDDDKAPPVLVVNKAFADRFFPGEDVIGKRIEPGAASRLGGETMREIVGVVGSIRFAALDPEPAPIYYFPYKQLPWQPPVVVLRTAVPPRALESVVRREVATLDPELPVFQVRTVSDLLSVQVAEPRFHTVLLGVFAGLAMLLTMVGLYGLVAYSIARRTQEIGVRMALGASRSSVLSMVLGEALRIIFVGVILGLMGAFSGSFLLRSMLVGISPLDPAVFSLATFLMALAGLAAAVLAARRATRVDPMVALRYE